MIDIAVNMTDPMFQGNYHGKTRHEADVEHVVARARARGVKKMLLTGTSLAESREALAMAKKYGELCVTTYQIATLNFRLALHGRRAPYEHIWDRATPAGGTTIHEGTQILHRRGQR